MQINSLTVSPLPMNPYLKSVCGKGADPLTIRRQAFIASNPFCLVMSFKRPDSNSVLPQQTINDCYHTKYSHIIPSMTALLTFHQ